MPGSLAKRHKRPAGLRVLSDFQSEAVAWIDRDGETRSTNDIQSLRDRSFEDAQICRKPVKYRHRGYYEGHYWFAGTGDLVWHESMNEYMALMWLDFKFEIVGIAAQPMCIFFADGSHHYPDFFAVHADGQQVLYDVKPLARFDEDVVRQFRRTKEFCARAGWDYQVLTDLSPHFAMNLEWVASYRQPVNAPAPHVRDRILRCVEDGRSLRELAEALNPMLPARHIHQIYHLIWRGDLVIEVSHLIHWETKVRRSSNAAMADRLGGRT